jgi:hypothetical protein
MDDMVLKSPNQLLEQACEAMNVPNPPANEQDWMKVFNCFAFNLPADLVKVECELLNVIFGSPLTELQVAEILQFQTRERQEKGNPRR